MDVSIKSIINEAIAFDYETKDPYFDLNMGGGWVFSIQHDHVAKGFPVCACTYDGINAAAYYDKSIKPANAEDLSHFSLENKMVLVGHNLPYDLGWYLAQHHKGDPEAALNKLRSMYLDGVILMDTMVLARLVDEHLMSLKLEALAKQFKVTQKSAAQLGDDFWDTGEYAKDKFERTGQQSHKKPKPETLLSCAYKNMDKITPEINLSYCMDDTRATYQLMEKFIAKLLKEYTAEELLKLIKRYSDMLFLSVDMRLRGVRVHIPTLSNACREVGSKLEHARQEVMNLLKSNLASADKDFMTKFLLQFYWHPKDVKEKEALIKRVITNAELRELRKHWDKYEKKVFEFIHIIEEGRFDDLKFSGVHPALMFILDGYKVNDFSITEKGRVSTKKEWIEEQNGRLGELLNRVRKVEKIMSGFIQPAMNTQSELQTLSQEYGKVYPEFKLGGARSMRYTCSSPNLQQVPKRDPEFKPICRGMFHASEGRALLAPDFSSQEQRLQVHVAYLLGAEGADKLKEEFDLDPNMDFHMKVAVMTDLICPKGCATVDCPDCKAGRTKSKSISLGKGYGMGGGKLCRTLGLPVNKKTIRGKTYEVAGAEGQMIIDKYDKLMPFIKQTIEILTQEAKDKGYIQAACGRHVHPPYFLNGFKREYLYHKLFNYAIQGSAAGQLHLGLANIYEYICKNPDCGLELIGTVHDEILATCPIDKIEECTDILENAMGNAIKLHVPVVIDTQVGKSWLGGDLNESDRSEG